MQANKHKFYLEFRNRQRPNNSAFLISNPNFGRNFWRSRNHLVNSIDLYFLEPIFLPLADDVICVRFGFLRSDPVMRIACELLQELSDARVIDVIHGEGCSLVVKPRKFKYFFFVLDSLNFCIVKITQSLFFVTELWAIKRDVSLFEKSDWKFIYTKYILAFFIAQSSPIPIKILVYNCL